jgi:transketolase
MEHPVALVEGGGTYRWHAGAPDDPTFEQAHGELLERIAGRMSALGLEPVASEAIPPLEPDRASLQGEPESGAGASRSGARVTGEFVAASYGEALLELAPLHPELVVLDADLASDCRIRAFEDAHPDRFVENGIAEQDMVSMAAGMARHGLLPVVNSFASFLASRANEQIYNQASERTKVIYALHYAGLIPAGPGKSHQSLRDASLLGAIPGIVVVQPSNAAETRELVRWAVEDSTDSVAIRLAIGPSPRLTQPPPGYRAQPGKGWVAREGGDALVFAYGPVMLNEGLVAAELLAERGVGLRVVAMPWLNRVDQAWLAEEAAGIEEIIVVEDHSAVGGLGDMLRRALAEASLEEGRRLSVLGVDGWPACGTPPEALRHHRLDGASLAESVSRLLVVAPA